MTNNRCECCGGTTKRWQELTDDEREVVKRLPQSTEYSEKERQTLHRWCTRCWNETAEPQFAEG